jgi:hypothetical protein
LDNVAKFDGPAHQLDYDMVWNAGIEGAPSIILLYCFDMSLPGYGFILPFFLSCLMPQITANGVYVSLEKTIDGVQVPSVQGDAVASDGKFKFLFLADGNNRPLCL